MNSIYNYLEELREKTPLVYHITNMVTINDCANITLAIGGSPLMSFNEEELEDILKFSSALVLNIGTMDNSMMNIAIKAGQIANKLKVPIVLDPVGVGATKERVKFVEKLIEMVKFSVIKGNMGEIKTLIGDSAKIKGVDSNEDMKDGKYIGCKLSKKLGCTIVITGKEDLVCYKDNIYTIKNGHKLMSKVTGTGCMTASLIGAYLGVTKDSFTAGFLGTLSMGICGEKAVKSLKNNEGTGTLKVKIIDNIYLLNKNDLELGDVVFE
ncbi:hydroxyethylthiazole kinase [Clostridium senegalense]|uniref:hydroxyethylthiazole kinase n=1 Tax=Clostridium senegalense TaxID=1465809 RepID=UPI001C0F4F84|nr:hydroxyethylthiazole kinase [Clostridium senegalense]MBU5227590.1 hydroxyethylthiazole kinase [Clostridium senegalense]